MPEAGFVTPGVGGYIRIHRQQRGCCGAAGVRHAAGQQGGQGWVDTSGYIDSKGAAVAQLVCGTWGRSREGCRVNITGMPQHNKPKGRRMSQHQRGGALRGGTATLGSLRISPALPSCVANALLALREPPGNLRLPPETTQRQGFQHAAQAPRRS